MLMKHILNVLTLVAVTLAPVTASPQTEVNIVERPAVTAYRAPLHGGYLTKLPVGKVQPKGWLREVLVRQSKGLNGQLGTVSAWLDKQDNQWLSDRGDHGWEEVPYWLRGYSSLAYILDDEAMKQEAQVWFDAVLTHLKTNGELGPSGTDGDPNTPDLWAKMPMLWALQTYYEHSGDERVLTAMTNYFKWELTIADDHFLKGLWQSKRGGDNEWSVVWLYNHTGDKAVLPLIAKLHRCGVDWTKKDDLPDWHGVNVAQGFREPATYYVYTGEEAMLQCAYSNHQEMRKRYGQVPGGMYGADENARQGCGDPRQGAETCAVVEQMASDEIMMGITGDGSWADHLEEVSFNTLPAALMPDMRALRYITSPNMAVSDGKNHAPSIDNSLRGMLSMSPFSSRCCQHNHGMGWPYLTEHLVMGTADGGLATMVCLASRTTAEVAGGKTVTLDIDTNYPFEEQVSMTIHTAEPTRFPLYLRIPKWAEKASLTINGNAVALGAQTPAGNYLRLDGTWNDGDKLCLMLPMSVSMRTWQKNKGSLTVDYGPLTLSLQIDERYIRRDSSDPAIVQDDSHWQATVDKSLWPAYEIFARSAWNYALETDDAGLPAGLSMERRPWPADNYPFTLESVPLLFTAKARRVPSWGLDETGMTAELPSRYESRSTESEQICLVPMGAARLRITAFPPADVDTSADARKSIVTLADPYILLDGDTYYAYGTGEADGIAVWTSHDLVGWERHDALALHRQNTTETQWFWAPEVYKKNGKYYMYYSANEHLYVATADKPTGPFRQVGDCMTKAVLGDEKCIDSSVFFDDDGTAWLFFVRFTDGNCIWMCQLEDDLMTLKAATLSKCINVSQSWEDRLGRVNEGPFVLKHGGIYYLTYSGNDFRSQDYAVGYAMSRTLSPSSGGAPSWSKYGGNPIVRRVEDLVGTGHHSFFTDKEGRLRIVFHAHDSEDDVYPRRMYIGTMEFVGNRLQLADGPVIRPAAATTPGGQNIGSLAPRDQQGAALSAHFYSLLGVQTDRPQRGICIHNGRKTVNTLSIK